jgi:hypothetical protein
MLRRLVSRRRECVDDMASLDERILIERTA